MDKLVSFDFDGTLTKPAVRLYVKTLIEKGIEVHITTSRNSNEVQKNNNWNDDLFEIADECGIKKENITFCCMANKSEFLIKKNFIFHLDDDLIELSFIRTDTEVIPISVFGNNNWRLECEEAIEKNILKNLN